MVLVSHSETVVLARTSAFCVMTLTAMPRLQKHFSRKVEGKEYSKYVVVIPQESVEKLGWKEGQKLEEKVQGRRYVLEPEDDED